MGRVVLPYIDIDREGMMRLELNGTVAIGKAEGKEDIATEVTKEQLSRRNSTSLYASAHSKDPFGNIVDARYHSKHFMEDFDMHFGTLRTIIPDEELKSNFGIERRMKSSRCFLFWGLVLALMTAAGNSAWATDGELDPSFGTGGKKIVQIAAGQREYVTSLAIQSNGKILGVGEIGDFASDSNRVVLFRLNADGSLDASFGNGGTIISNSQRHAPKLVLLGDGKFLTAATTNILGDTWDFAVTKYNADGTPDQSFGANGYAVNGSGHAQWLLVQPDGKIVLVGFLPIFRNGSDYLAARFNADGTVDQTFGIGGRVQTSFTSGRNSADNALAGALQSDGKIVLTGFAGGFSPVMIRYNTDGGVDTSFGLDGIVMSSSFGATANRILIQPDGKIVVSGGGFVVARYNSNGTTDQTFGSGGKVAGGFGTGNGAAHALAIDGNGRLYVSGSVCYTNTGNCAFLVSRYTKVGGHDAGFGTNGFVVTEFTGALDEANAEILQEKGGKLILAGYAAEPSASDVDFSLARYLTDTSRWTTADRLIDYPPDILGLDDE